MNVFLMGLGIGIIIGFIMFCIGSAIVFDAYGNNRWKTEKRYTILEEKAIIDGTYEFPEDDTI